MGLYLQKNGEGRIIGWARTNTDEDVLNLGWEVTDDSTIDLLRGKRLGGTLDQGTYVEPPPAALLVPLADFLQLFTATQFKTLADARATDADVAHFFAIAEALGALDVLHPGVQSRLALLVGKGLLKQGDMERIIKGERP